MNKQQIIQRLKGGPCRLRFIKADDSQREMIATLDNMIIPYQEPLTIQPETKKDKPTQSVWDMDAQGWRSFRWERVRWFEGQSFPKGVTE